MASSPATKVAHRPKAEGSLGTSLAETDIERARGELRTLFGSIRVWQTTGKCVWKLIFAKLRRLCYEPPGISK